MSLLQIAYTLLTIAFVSSIVAAVVLDEQEERYAPIPGLLLAAIVANLVRRRLSPVDLTIPLDVFASRALFFVWPIGVAFAVLWAFEKRKSAGGLLIFTGLLVIALGCFPHAFDGGRVVYLAQGIAAFAATSAIGLVLFTLSQVPTKLSRFETAAVFCAMGEGTAAAVGHFVKGQWWPAVVVYCALYLALIILHARVLWTAQQPTLRESSPFSSNGFSP